MLVMKRLIIQFCVFASMLACASSAWADMRVRDFGMLDSDVDALVAEPVRDHNSGKYCAIVKIITTQSGFSFDLGIMGAPEKITYKENLGEIWVYMPVGARKIKIAHPKFGQLDTDTQDGYFWFPRGGLEEAKSYRLVLSTGGGEVPDTDKKQLGWVVLDSEPSGADVYIGVGDALPEYVGTTPFQKKYEYGHYTYSIRKNMYHDCVGVIELNQSKIQNTYPMQPAFGKIHITSTPAGATATVEGVAGTITTPGTTGDLKSGTYTVRLTRELYAPVTRQVTVSDGVTTELDVPLAANFASVTISSLEGAEISVNGKRAGVGTVTQDLAEGIYDVQATKAHHRDATRQIEVEANKPLSISLKPTPIYGSIDVMTTPIGADVTIGGKSYGQSPLTIEQILEGEYDVVMSKAGCATVTQHVTVAEGKSVEVSATLPQGREINISCATAGAHIVVDGTDMGASPYTGSLSFGSHKVYATAGGKRTAERTVEVPNGSGALQPLALSFSYETFAVKGVEFTMIAVEGGTFTMGATPEQGSDAAGDEKPTHQVTLSSYYIGETEVTQALWQAVMGENPSKYKGANLPVEQVSWDDCQEFIKKLNALTGKNFRLPTEAEWEFAARGGNKSRGYKYSGSNSLRDVAWNWDNSGDKTHPVKTKQANELGIYDMSGNVWEWCQDWYGDYSSVAQTNPKGPTTGRYRVIRGGGISNFSGDCRLSYRSYGDCGSHDYGFRLVLSAE